MKTFTDHSAQLCRPIRRRPRRAMTLVELLLAVTVTSILSIGASNLVIAGLRIDRVMLDSDRQVSEMELAIRRMTHNIRTGYLVSVNGTTGITLTSQADPGNNGQNYTVTYAYNSANQTLTESSTQYGATPPVNVIAYNVTAFTISEVTTSPVVISIDITIAGSATAPATRRAFQILNRNS